MVYIKEIGTFTGYKPKLRSKFAEQFDNATSNRGWDILQEEVKLELWTNRFGEQARSTCEELIHETPVVMRDFVTLKVKYPLNLGTALSHDSD